MYNVLIVEDEMLVRIGIKASIDWGKYNMQIVGDAIDGISGLNLFKKLVPDILITDINLPRLNGAQLIEQAYKINPQCAIIVISCVDDFDILRNLLQYNIVDYLLKSSINTKDIEATLVKAKMRLDHLRIDNNSVNIEEEDTDRKIVDYIYSDNHSVSDNTDERFEIEEEHNNYHLLLYVTEVQKNINVISKTIIELLTKYFKTHTKLIPIIKDEYKILVMIKNKKLTKDIIIKKLTDFQVYLYKALNIKVFCSIEDNSHDYYQLKRSFNQFCGYVEHINVLDKFPHIDEAFSKNSHRCISKLVNLTFEIFAEYIKRKPLEYMVTEIKHYLARDIYCFNEFRILANNIMIEIANTYNVFSSETIQEIDKRCLSAKTFLDIYRLYRYQFQEIADHYSLRIDLKPEIRQSLVYISEHYNNQISLEEVANKVSLSPNYLSSVFKKEIGITLVDYLIKYRIEKAKSLLENTEDYLYEIADKTGFSNESYFSKMFKKITGFSPIGWRKLMKS